MAAASSQDGFGRRVLIVLAAVAATYVVWRCLDVLLLALGALVLAALLRALADPLARVTRLPAALAVAAVTLAGLALIGAMVALFGLEIRAQAQDLSARLPQAWSKVEAWVQGLPLADDLVSRLNELPIAQGHGVASRVTGFVASFAGAATNLMLVLAAAGYLAVSPGVYRKGAIRLMPEGFRPKAARLIDQGAGALKRWLLAQAVSMSVVGLLSGLGLWLAGVPSPAALGLLAGLLEFIPIIGPILSAIPFVLMGLTVDLATAGWAFLVFLVVQQLESNAITPLIQRKVVAIPPVVTLFAVAVAGLIFGLLGVALAGPLTVLAVTAVRVLWLGEDEGEAADKGDGG